MAVTQNKLVVGGATVTITRPVSKAGTGVATDCGALLNGVTLTPTFSQYHADIEQELFPGKYWYTDKEFKVDCEMGEPDLANIQNAWDVVNAILGTTTKTLNFGTAGTSDFIPADLVVSITGFSPGATTATSLRTILIDKALCATPGAMTISKRAIATLKTSFMGTFNTGTSRVGQFSDVLT